MRSVADAATPAPPSGSPVNSRVCCFRFYLYFYCKVQSRAVSIQTLNRSELKTEAHSIDREIAVAVKTIQEDLKKIYLWGKKGA